MPCSNYGELIIETKKVRDILSKISDSRLDLMKKSVFITLGYRQNLAAAITFLAESVSVIPLTKVNPRQIKEIQREGKNRDRGAYI